MNRKSSGYILYTLLILSSISFIIFLLTLYSIRSALHASSHAVDSSQAHDLAQSGIARAEYFLNGNDGHSISWETDNYEEQMNGFGGIKISVKKFGFFSRILSIGQRKLIADSISGLASRTVPDLFKHSMVLTSVSGGCLFLVNTTVQGTIVLHHGYITNKPHGRRPIPVYEKRTFTFPSPKVPFDSLSYANTIQEILQNTPPEGPVIPYKEGTHSSRTTADSLFTSGKMIVIEGDFFMQYPVSHKKIIVNGNAHIPANVSCNDLWLRAKSISINGSYSEHSLFVADSGITITGGSHNSQFIATDSIIVSGDPVLGRSNCITVLRKLRKDSTFTGGIYIKSNRELKGSLISLIDPQCIASKMVPYDVSISIHPGFHLKGYIITDHDIDIQNGILEGGMWVRSVLTRYNSVSYTNALIGVTIKALKEEISFPLIGDPPLRVIISGDSDF
jgi:hypothetical protein